MKEENTQITKNSNMARKLQEFLKYIKTYVGLKETSIKLIIGYLKIACSLTVELMKAAILILSR